MLDFKNRYRRYIINQYYKSKGLEYTNDDLLEYIHNNILNLKSYVQKHDIDNDFSRELPKAIVHRFLSYSHNCNQSDIVGEYTLKRIWLHNSLIHGFYSKSEYGEVNVGHLKRLIIYCFEKKLGIKGINGVEFVDAILSQKFIDNTEFVETKM